MLNKPKLLIPERRLSTTGLRSVSAVFAASLLVGLAAHIIVPLPFTPVPMSMAPFAVLLVGLVLTPRTAAAALIAYLVEGALGLPFFAPNGPAGVAHLAWPTAGYLLAFPIAAFSVAAIYRALGKRFFSAVLACAAGSVVLFAIGAAWLALSLHLSVRSAIAAGILPFLMGDAVKIIAAASAASAWQRIRN